MNKSKIPTIIGVIFLVVGLAVGLLLVKNKTLFRLGATPEATPKDVRLTNITDNSFAVSWITDKKVLGFISWGESDNQLNKTEPDEFIDPGLTHTLSVINLDANKTYFFKINSDGTEYDNNGTAWQVKTGAKLAQNQKQISVYGSVFTQSGEPAANALVYITVAGSSPLSTTTSRNGSWVLPISSARNQDLSSLATINEKTSLLEISVNAGSDGVASAQIYPQSGQPVPAITLGKTFDFKNLPASVASDIPKASIGLPDEETATRSSGFDVGDTISGGTAPKTVTLDSIDPGETVTTVKPELFGEGPSGTTITITLESEPQTATVKIPSSGDWQWTPPANLPAGTHKVTIKWKDASGILRSLTRTFVVEASEGPAFTSTPSATPTKKVTPSLSPTPTSRVSATPTATLSPTRYATPESGSLTPTILLFIMGIGVLIFASLVWRKSDA